MTLDDRVIVGGIPFTASLPSAAVETLLEHARSGEQLAARLTNAACIAEAKTNPAYREVLLGPGINFPDGTPVVWFMRKAVNDASLTAVRGPNLMRSTLEAGIDQGLRHFFLGTTDETLAALTTQVQATYPGVTVVGTYSPPFAPLDDAFIADCESHIRATDAQVVWVGLGTPKQDFVGAKLAESTGLVCVAVGAAFDFIAGTTKEAPTWLQHTGMEWSYRLMQEPRRLWKRYLVGNAVFLKAALWDDRRAGLRRRH